MKLLRDFPALRLFSNEGDKRDIAAGFPEAKATHWTNAAQAAHGLAAETGSETVLLIEQHVTPAKEAEVVTVDQVLCNSGAVIRYPAKSVVTGLHLSRGLLLTPIKAIEDSASILPVPKLTAPHSVGSFAGNETPEMAFEAGYAIATGQSARSRVTANRLALSASLGTDALNGCWWVLGSLAGLLDRETLGDAWVRHEELLSRPRDIQRHIAGEARRVRLETGLPVAALSQDQSRVMKAMLSDWPAEDIWRNFISGCRTLGPEGDTLADRYQKAVGHIWPDAS